MEDEIIRLYLDGWTNKALSKKFNVHRTTIQRILKRKGVRLRKPVETSRKHKILHFTGEALNEKSAYILGLIYADGNINRNCIEIALHEQDKSLLEEISRFIYGKVVLSKRKGGLRSWGEKEYICADQYRFMVTSKSVCDKLREMGVSKKKSLLIKFPNLKDQFVSHFIRGYFDGDGSIIIPRKRSSVSISIVSNYKFCNDLKSIIKKFLNINIYVRNKTKKVGYVSISGKKQVKQFLDWLYCDATICMERKWVKYKQIDESRK